ncbi:MAG: hypothetical protein PHG47_11225 [Sulfuricella sp.]|nr:hypothetical protein [Sulfuricella sp.]
MITLPSVIDRHAQEAASFSISVQGHLMAMGGPDGPLDIVLVALGTVIVLLVCFYTVKFLIRPRENNPDHIKRRVLRDDF